LSYLIWLRNKSLNELAKHLYDKHEIVRPYLKKAADLYQPKVIDPPAQKSEFNLRADQDDLMFNGYEDSVEDEKANQEAFVRSQNFTDESKENRFKKLSFLNNKTPEEQEDEFPLVKPAIAQQKSPKIVIDDQFLNAVKPDDIKHNEESLLENKSILDNDTFDSRPIEFIKASESIDPLKARDDTVINDPNLEWITQGDTALLNRKRNIKAAQKEHEEKNNVVIGENVKNEPESNVLELQ